MSPNAPRPSAETLDALSRLLRDAQYYWDLPGLALGAGNRDGLFFGGAAGVRKASDTAPLETGDIFHMASLAKLFTGTGILLLLQDGLLGLDDPVRLHGDDPASFDPAVYLHRIQLPTSKVNNTMCHPALHTATRTMSGR